MGIANQLDESMIAKINSIQIRAKSLVNDVFAGEYESAFKGRGLEFEEVREYQPGDDIRSIDWNVTARANRPYIKTYKDERELTIMFVVDVSASARFGTRSKFKNEVAAEITALLAYTALRSNDKVGLLIFSDHVEHYIPPKKGRGHIWRLIREILAYESESKKTDLEVPLRFLNQVLKKRCITFLISDFQEDNFKSQIQTTARRHDLIAFGIYDQREIELPNVGYIELEDNETGETILVNTSSKSFRDSFLRTAKISLKDQKEFFRRSGIDFVHIQTDEAYLDPIIKFFRSRESRRKT